MDLIASVVKSQGRNGVSVVKGEERVVQNKIALVAGLASYPLPQKVPSEATLSRNSYVK